MRLVLTVVSILVVLAIGGLIARSQFQASRPPMSAVAPDASAASGTSDAASSAEAPGLPPMAAVLINASASGASEPTHAQQKQFMDALSQVMHQKAAPNDADGK